MRNKFMILCVFILPILAACSTGQATETSLPTVVESPTATLPVPTEAISGCTSVNAAPTAVVSSSVPAISEADYVFGPEDAPVTLIEYCDFQAPICRSMAAVVGNLSAKHPGQIRVIFRPVPLVGQLDKTELAVQAAIAAGDQDKFWEMYDVLFVKSDQWDALTPELFEDWVTQEASGLGMNGSQFKAGMKSQATVDRMTSMFNAARDFGLDRIPLVLINGSPQPTFAIDYTSIEAAVSLITLAERQFTTCPSFEIDPAKQYIATLHTAKGDIVLELYADKAPQTVNSFVFLARQGWFDGVTFHRVIPGFMAQTGDPSGTGRGNPGYLFKNEIDPSLNSINLEYWQWPIPVPTRTAVSSLSRTRPPRTSTGCTPSLGACSAAWMCSKASLPAILKPAPACPPGIYYSR